MESKELKKLFEKEEKLKEIFLSKIELTGLKERLQKRLDILSSYVDEEEVPEPEELARLKRLDQQNEEDMQQFLRMVRGSDLEKALLNKRRENEIKTEENKEQEIDTLPTTAKRRRLSYIIHSEKEQISQKTFQSSLRTLLMRDDPKKK